MEGQPFMLRVHSICFVNTGGVPDSMVLHVPLRLICYVQGMEYIFSSSLVDQRVEQVRIDGVDD